MSHRADSPRDPPFERRSIGRARGDVLAASRADSDDSETSVDSAATPAVTLVQDVLPEAAAGGGIVSGPRYCLAPDRLDDGDVAATTDVRDVLGESARSVFGEYDAAAVFPGRAPVHLGLVRAT